MLMFSLLVPARARASAPLDAALILVLLSQPLTVE